MNRGAAALAAALIFLACDAPPAYQPPISVTGTFSDERTRIVIEPGPDDEYVARVERQQKRFDEFRHIYNSERPHDAQRSTACRELITCVSKIHRSVQQRASCDLSQVLTLRGIGRSMLERSLAVRANDRRKV